MRRAFFTCLSIGFLPLLILASALALVFADQAAILPGDFMGFLQYRPFFVAFLGVVLGCWFNRSRAVFAMLVLSFCYWFFSVRQNSFGHRETDFSNWHRFILYR